jgi:transcriptional regulator with GAF, ATPase, and Fis domain
MRGRIVTFLPMKMLVAWLGTADLRAPDLGDDADIGPIAQALTARSFGRALLLADQEANRVSKFGAWLRARTSIPIEIQTAKLSSPTNFGEIYKAAIAALDGQLARMKQQTELTFHLSPGTPAMAAVWIILGKTRYSAELIESSKQYGVRTASVPFDISAELIPDLLRNADKRLTELSRAASPETARFGDIIYRSEAMDRVIVRAKRAAVRSYPVLIEGESGTGKELLAKAIHAASHRGNNPLRIMNCGAIPTELVESELFGHEKGAFTGATQARPGYFEDADGGTLFLDEIGELPLKAQVKLLRILQDDEVTRVGSTKPRKVDVRIIAATNRDLMIEVAQGRFREDLFFRLAVLVLKVPPLRQREGDLGPLIDGLLDRINESSTQEPGYQRKKISPAAKNLLLLHPWPGNVRELQNTLQRAAVWSDADKIEPDDIREALLPFESRPRPNDDEILDRPLGQGLDLRKLIGTVARHYLCRAIETAHGNKTRAAELIGLPNHQTLTNWLERYGVG